MPVSTNTPAVARGNRNVLIPPFPNVGPLRAAGRPSLPAIAQQRRRAISTTLLLAETE
jgi:hypothetical protein